LFVREGVKHFPFSVLDLNLKSFSEFNISNENGDLLVAWDDLRFAIGKRASFKRPFL
jgi:hypothetical protein